MALSIPPDLSGPMQDGFRFYRGAPATRQFLKLARSGAAWSPAWPRRLARWAAKRRVKIDVPEHFTLLSSGFHGIGQPRCIFVALRTIEQMRMRPPYRPAIWTIADGTPRRYGPTESILRPSWHASPAGPPPVSEAPSPPVAPAPASTPRHPDRAVFGILHG